MVICSRQNDLRAADISGMVLSMLCLDLPFFFQLCQFFTEIRRDYIDVRPEFEQRPDTPQGNRSASCNKYLFIRNIYKHWKIRSFHLIQYTPFKSVMPAHYGDSACIEQNHSIYSSELQIHAAILLPPFLPLATIYGISLSVRISSLDCTTLTNPTGAAMISSGLSFPSLISS